MKVETYRAGTCAECWNYTDTSLVDCGSVFGEKELCEPCRHAYAPKRPVLVTGRLKGHAK
jgi:hypothetical protein